MDKNLEIWVFGDTFGYYKKTTTKKTGSVACIGTHALHLEFLAKANLYLLSLGSQNNIYQFYII